MCEAIRGMIEEGRLAGMEQGMEKGMKCGMEQGVKQGVEQGIRALIEVCKDIGVSKEETMARVLDNFSIPGEDAQEYIKRYWKQ